jgi:ParB family chromosome partitioning protein
MTAVDTVGQLEHIPAAQIVAGPNDRGTFDTVALEALAQSIHRDGLAQPPTLRPLADGRFEIVAGERRVRAMRLLGWETVPAFVRTLDDGQASAIMLVENMVRVNLDALEEGKAYRARLEAGSSVSELAELVGVSARTVRARLDLLTLSDTARGLVASGNLGLGQAAQLVGLDADRQCVALRALAAGDLSSVAFTAVCDRLRREQEAEPMFSPDAFWSVEEYVTHGDQADKLSTMNPQLTTGEVAEMVGVKPASIRQYLARGVFPPPDGHLGATPWWKPETVAAWQTSRRGPGRPAVVSKKM